MPYCRAASLFPTHLAARLFAQYVFQWHFCHHGGDSDKIVSLSLSFPFLPSRKLSSEQGTIMFRPWSCSTVKTPCACRWRTCQCVWLCSVTVTCEDVEAKDCIGSLVKENQSRQTRRQFPILVATMTTRELSGPAPLSTRHKVAHSQRHEGPA